MKLIKILFILIVGLVIANVTLTNRTVDDSLVVSNLDKQIASLQNQNTILRAEVASLGSLGAVQSKIAAAGFTDAPKVVSLQDTSSVALR